MTVREELDELGRKLTARAKALALPNKKTGNLDKSFSFETSFISNDQFQIVVNEKYYGKFLNNKTGYMDKAIEETIPKGINEIINTITGEIMNKITTKL